VTTPGRVDVAIIGGGPAGAALAARLTDSGRDVVVLERAPHWRWRACGVFASPAAMAALRRTGLDDPTLDAVARRIPAMNVETPAGTAFQLTYGAEHGGAEAVGFDRSKLDPALLQLARDRGADVRTGSNVIAVDLDHGDLEVRSMDGEVKHLRAAVVVGADGLRSIVARAAGVARSPRLGPRVGLTYHLETIDRPETRDARMCVLRDGYVGIAPVPGGRVNIGIVLEASWRPRLARLGAAAVTETIVESVTRRGGATAASGPVRRCDPIAGASPLGHRVTRRSGTSSDRGVGWLLVGDAAGFLDPFTGEGLHRALVSAELAARAVLANDFDRPAALAAYDRQMRRRFLAKDAVSWLVQGFLGRPGLFEYAARRLASRPSTRATMGLVMGDLIPASRGLDPRYLATLLAP
jgi:menaquinone-9 beta-reductase